jgi:hypothetical protein
MRVSKLLNVITHRENGAAGICTCCEHQFQSQNPLLSRGFEQRILMGLRDSNFMAYIVYTTFTGFPYFVVTRSSRSH